MKWVKRIIIISVIASFIFLAFYKPMGINLEGNWSAKKIVLADKQIYPRLIDKFITIGSQVRIDDRTNSISFLTEENDITVNYKFINESNGDYKIKLFSNEKSLNGEFDLMIDTVHLGPNAYKVELRFQLNRTFLNFEREVHIKPRKPEFPKKGQV